ncbi:RNA-directed DNA polymerase, eukaryota, reverse transcriptase zinc-binding domain protein [Tanacetum coccineum]
MLESADNHLISFIFFGYAANSGVERRGLWRELNRHKVITAGHPWVICGDFNVTLNANGHSAGSAHMSNDMVEFNDCVNQIEVDDLCSFGLHYTWTKNLHMVRKGDVFGILKKLDRVMVNEYFINKYSLAHAIFMPDLISAPMVLILPNCLKRKKKSFKFANYSTDKEDFLKIVEEKWNVDIDGYSMYSFAKKMKALKAPLNNLNRRNGNLIENVKKLKNDLSDIQTAIDANPFNKSLRERECTFLKSYLDAVSDEEKLLFQKSKIKWLTYEDKNNALFPKVLKGNHQRNIIYSVYDEGGQSSLLSERDAKFMVREVNDKEIKDAMFCIGDNKAPVLDGELNATIIALVPKMDSPLKVSDFKSIACCNVVYKYISKIITGRIKGCLDKLINLNQSAFIHGRQNHDNILLAQELIKGYDKGRGPKELLARLIFRRHMIL